MSEVVNTTIECEELKIKLNDKDCILQIKKDLTWGEVKVILNKCQVNGSFSFTNFLDLVATSAISGGLPFDNNLVNFNNLGMTQFSELLGRVLKIIPLETWGNNFGAEGLLGLIPQIKTT